jgi:hypothetical protein
MLLEMKIIQSPSSFDLLEEKKVAYVRGNNNLTIPSMSSDSGTSILNEGISQKGIKLKKTIKI